MILKWFICVVRKQLNMVIYVVLIFVVKCFLIQSILVNALNTIVHGYETSFNDNEPNNIKLLDELDNNMKPIRFRHKRDDRNVKFVAAVLPENRRGILFGLRNSISDAYDRRFKLLNTSVGTNVVDVDSINGNVYLAENKNLDYENDNMQPLTIVVQAILRYDPKGTSFYSEFLTLN